MSPDAYLALAAACAVIALLLALELRTFNAEGRPKTYAAMSAAFFFFLSEAAGTTIHLAFLYL